MDAITSPRAQKTIQSILSAYFEAVVESPLVVMETLLQVQFHPKSSNDLLQELSVTEPDSQYLSRLHGDFIDYSKDIVEYSGNWALLNGSITHCIWKQSFNFFQPLLEEGLNDAIDLFDDHNIWTCALSNAITGILLSPLELIRTRLIITSTKQKRLNTPFHVLSGISNFERPVGSSLLATLYQVRTVTPTFIVYTISSLVKFTAQSYFEHELGIDQTFTPLLYHLAKICTLALEAFIVTPFELARKRIFSQHLANVSTSSPTSPASFQNQPSMTFETCIETDPTYYSGIFSCIYTIYKAEGGAPPSGTSSRRKKKRKTSGNVSASSSGRNWQEVYGGEIGPEGDGSVNPLVEDKPNSSVFGGISTLLRGATTRFLRNTIEYVSRESPLVGFNSSIGSRDFNSLFK